MADKTIEELKKENEALKKEIKNSGGAEELKEATNKITSLKRQLSERKKESVDKADEDVVKSVKKNKSITSKQLGAFQKGTKGKATVEKSKVNNGR